MATETIIDPALDNTPTGGDAVVTLTQEKIDSIISTAVGRATNPLRSQITAAEARATQLANELQAAKDEAARSKSNSSKTGTGDAAEQVAALEAKIQEMHNAGRGTQEELERQKKIAIDREKEVKIARDEAVNIRKDIAISQAASKLEFVDLGVVSKLTKDYITVDAETGRYVVVGDNGQPRMNYAYEPMSLDEFYNDFAAKNKYLVRSNYTGGTGQHESSRSTLSNNGKYELAEVFGPKSDASKAMALKKADPAEYARLKTVAKTARLIA